jgi:hypothetical protein
MTTCPGPDYPTYAPATGLEDARAVLNAFERNAPAYPSRLTVTVTIDEDTMTPQIGLELDNTDGRAHVSLTRLQAFADDLDLTEMESGDTWREWSGRAGDSNLDVVLYLEGPPETLHHRARRLLWQAASRIAHDSALDVLLVASAALGAATAAATRRARAR